MEQYLDVNVNVINLFPTKLIEHINEIYISFYNNTNIDKIYKVYHLHMVENPVKIVVVQNERC